MLQRYFLIYHIKYFSESALDVFLMYFSDQQSHRGRHRDYHRYNSHFHFYHNVISFFIISFQSLPF